jgi:hypothetical protein
MLPKERWCEVRAAFIWDRDVYMVMKALAYRVEYFLNT